MVDDGIVCSVHPISHVDAQILSYVNCSDPMGYSYPQLFLQENGSSDQSYIESSIDHISVSHHQFIYLELYQSNRPSIVIHFILCSHPHPSLW
jgi:hypothetical protein